MNQELKAHSWERPGEPADIKAFVLSLYLAGQVPTEACDWAEDAHHRWRFGRGRGVYELLSPQGDWSFKSHPTLPQVVFSGAIYPGDEQNRRFHRDDEMAVEALKETARVAASAIWKHMRKSGVEERGSARLLYQGRWITIDLTPVKAAATA